MCEIKRVANAADLTFENLPILNLNIESYNSLIHLKDSMDFQISMFTNRMKETQGFELNNIRGKDLSSQCTHNGILKREINVSGSYYFCDCLNSYVGDNCEVSPLVATTIRHYVNKIIENLKIEIQSQIHITRKIFIVKAMILALQFKVDLEIVAEILEISNKFLIKQYREKKRQRDIFAD